MLLCVLFVSQSLLLYLIQFPGAYILPLDCKLNFYNLFIGISAMLNVQYKLSCAIQGNFKSATKSEYDLVSLAIFDSKKNLSI